MHAIKGGWVGQTFALAKLNESRGRTEGRKSRIRRSKEERKAMVETFIKKYQDSNNGNFPSLSLTHKEVGGSFYTVREIVRDIIQENRVLCPAKLMVEENSTDQSFEDHSVFSIATDLQDPLIVDSKKILQESGNLQGFNEDLSLQTENIQRTSKDQSHLQTNNLQDSSGEQTYLELKGVNEEMIGVSDGQFPAFGQLKADSVPTVSGSQINVTNAESIEPTNSDFQVDLSVPAGNFFEKEMAVLEAKVSPLTADVIVETFPLRPVATLNDNIVEVQAEGRHLNNFSHEKSTKVGLGERNCNFSPEQEESMKKSDFVEGRVMDDSSSLLLGENCLPRDKEVVGDVDSLLENQKQLKECANEFEGNEHLEAKAAGGNITTHCNQSEALGTGAILSQTVVNGKNLNGACVSVAKAGEEIFDKKAETQPDNVSLRKNNPTLDRINLDSWDGKTKRPVKTESNPLLAVFKAFVDAFVKFWSE